MEFRVFQSNNNSYKVSDTHLHVLGFGFIALKDLFLYTIKSENREIFLLSGQYTPGEFYNAIFYNNDQFITFLKNNPLLNQLEKNVSKVEYAKRDGEYLIFTDGTALSWYQRYANSSHELWFRFTSEEKPTVKQWLNSLYHEEEFFEDTGNMTQTADSDIPDHQIIPLNQWEKNEAYWAQHYKKELKKGPGCTKVFLFILLSLILIYFIASLLP